MILLFLSEIPMHFVSDVALLLKNEKNKALVLVSVIREASWDCWIGKHWHGSGEEARALWLHNLIQL